MDDLILTLSSICLVSVLSGILSALIPSGGIKKAFSTLCAVILIYTIVSPLTALGKKRISEDVFSTERISEKLSYEDRTAQVMLYENILSKALSDNLIQEGYDVDVKVKACNAEEPIVESVTVTGRLSDEEKIFIEGILRKSFKEVAVIFTEETNG